MSAMMAANRRFPMTTMIAEVYDAFIAAGAPEDKARAAAQTLANNDARFAKLESDMLVVKWMLGVLLAGVVSLVAKAYI